ncbi:FVU5 protein [Dolichomitus sp. PSUC_FEM 10030005]|nr:FVU5 protein [Dolichomitus sp. PSUC_FEM 10030005]
MELMDNDAENVEFMVRWLKEHNIDPLIFNVDQLRGPPVNIPEPLDVEIAKRRANVAGGASSREQRRDNNRSPQPGSSRHDDRLQDVSISDHSTDDETEDTPEDSLDPRYHTRPTRNGLENQNDIDPILPGTAIDNHIHDALRLVKVYSLRENIHEFTLLIGQMYYRMYDNGDSTAMLANSDPMFRLNRLETNSSPSPEDINSIERQIGVLEGLHVEEPTQQRHEDSRLLTRKDVYSGKNNVRTEIPMLQIMRLVHRLVILSTRLQIKDLVTEIRNEEKTIIDLIESCFQSSIANISNLIVDHGEFLASHNILVPYILVFCWYRGWCRFSKMDRQKENFLLRALDYIPATRTPFDQYFSNIITQHYPIYRVPKVNELIDELNILAVKPSFVESGYRGANKPYDRKIQQQWLDVDFQRTDALLRTHGPDRIKTAYPKSLLFLEMKNRELTGRSQVYSKIRN